MNYLDRSLNDRELELTKQLDPTFKLISGIGASSLYNPKTDFIRVLDKKPFGPAIEPDDID